MTIEASSLILTLDLQLDHLSLAIFNLTGLTPLYTTVAQFPDSSGVSHLDNIVGALDQVLEQAAATISALLPKVRSIATTASTDLAVFLTPSAPSILSQLSPYDCLQAQLRKAKCFFADANYDKHVHTSSSLGFTTQLPQRSLAAATSPVASSETAHLVEDAPRTFAERVSGLAKSDAWDHCAYVLPIGAFLDSLLLGRIAPCNSTLASSTGIFNCGTLLWDTLKANACSHGKGSKLISMLPMICSMQNTLPVGSWLMKRFGFSSDCRLVSNLPSSITGHISSLSSLDDGTLHFSASDHVVLPVEDDLDLDQQSVMVNPLSMLDHGHHTSRLAVVQMTAAGQARSVVRRSYTKTWKAFNQLVQAVCPGGSVGLDNKLFTLFIPSGPHKGFRRFENGTRVGEFEDLRANARCVIEGQALEVRKVVSQIKVQDRYRSALQASEYRGAAGCLPFAPMDATLKVPRWHTWGRAAGNERIAKVYAHVLGAPIMADEVEVRRCAQEGDYAPSMTDQVTRPSWGACYVAAYLLERKGSQDFNTCIESLMRRVPLEAPHRSLRRARSTLACVKEDDGDIDSSANGYVSDVARVNAIDSVHPTRSVRSKRSVTLSVNAGQYSLLSAARERSSSVNSTPLLTVSSSPTQSSPYTYSSLPTSPRDNLTLSPSYIEPTGGEAALTSKDNGRRGTVLLGELDEDLWQFYGSLLEEHIRLSDMVNETTSSNQQL